MEGMLAEVALLVLGNFANPRFWIGAAVDLAGLLILVRQIPRRPIGPGAAAALAAVAAASVLLRACEMIIAPHLLFAVVALGAAFRVERPEDRLYLALLFAALCRIGRTLLIGVLFVEDTHVAIFCVGIAVRLALFALCSCYVARVASTPKTLPDWMLLVASLAQVVFVQVVGSASLGDNRLYQLTESFICLGALCTVWAAIWRIDVERKDRDLREVEHAVESRYDLFEQRKELNGAVARLHHDMKHQLAGLAALQGTSGFYEAVDELQRSISGYETVFDTGNEVLDAILSEKARQAAEVGVSLQVVADFSSIGFVRPVDLCATMGNALANAVEAAQRVRDPEKRIVTVKSASLGGYLVVKVRNRFDGSLRHADGKLLSTKQEPGHGIGLSSIRYSLERYQGRADVKAQGDLFELTMFFKLPD